MLDKHQQELPHSFSSDCDEEESQSPVQSPEKMKCVIEKTE
jgi:hypothetical protein